jgi:zinc-ribbon domain
MSVFCSKCGAEVVGNDRFCAKCGNDVTAAAPAVAAAPAAAPYGAPPPPLPGYGAPPPAGYAAPPPPGYPAPGPMQVLSPGQVPMSVAMPPPEPAKKSGMMMWVLIAAAAAGGYYYYHQHPPAQTQTTPPTTQPQTAPQPGGAPPQPATPAQPGGPGPGGPNAALVQAQQWSSQEQPVNGYVQVQNGKWVNGSNVPIQTAVLECDQYDANQTVLAQNQTNLTLSNPPLVPGNNATFNNFNAGQIVQNVNTVNCGIVSVTPAGN